MLTIGLRNIPKSQLQTVMWWSFAAVSGGFWILLQLSKHNRAKFQLCCAETEPSCDAALAQQLRHHSYSSVPKATKCRRSCGNFALLHFPPLVKAAGLEPEVLRNSKNTLLPLQMSGRRKQRPLGPEPAGRRGGSVSGTYSQRSIKEPRGTPLWWRLNGITRKRRRTFLFCSAGKPDRIVK